MLASGIKSTRRTGKIKSTKKILNYSEIHKMLVDSLIKYNINVGALISEIQQNAGRFINKIQHKRRCINFLKCNKIFIVPLLSV